MLLGCVVSRKSITGGRRRERGITKRTPRVNLASVHVQGIASFQLQVRFQNKVSCLCNDIEESHSDVQPRRHRTLSSRIEIQVQILEFMMDHVSLLSSPMNHYLPDHQRGTETLQQSNSKARVNRIFTNSYQRLPSEPCPKPPPPSS